MTNLKEKEIWNNLFNEAKKVLNPRDLTDSVSAAILTKDNHIYTGVCIDTSCSLGM